ncbi:MAG: cytochrome c [Verrucomicrobiota bacterium]
MSDETKSCSTETGTEPTAARSQLPMWILVVLLTLLYLGGIYFDHHSGWFDQQVYSPFANAAVLEAYQPKSGAAAALAAGRKSYEAVCGTCHGNDGLGKPGQAPQLAGSEWVIAKGYNRLAHIPLAGISGPIQVAGKDWNMAMAAMGAALSDADLANVLTYIRGSWGNKAGEVTADEIKAIRAGIGRPQPLSLEQLNALPE